MKTFKVLYTKILNSCKKTVNKTIFSLIIYSLDNFNRFHALFSSISDFSEDSSHKPNSEKNKTAGQWEAPADDKQLLVC